MSASELNGPDNVVVIKVIGVGGAGNNAVNRMIEADTPGVEFVAINTDKPMLSQSLADTKIQIGMRLTGGRGAGADPSVGRAAAEESRNEIAKALEGTHMAFIACGMGGGTGTGAAPVVAEIAREVGALTVGVVTKPFKFEGAVRMRQADEGIAALYDKVDALFVIPNERLKEVTDQKITFMNAFKVADDVLHKAVSSISELVKKTDMMNLDFADITTVMKNSGYAHMGVGIASGRDKANEAARTAIESPLMMTSIKGARGVVVHVCGSFDLELEDVVSAAALIESEAHPDVNLIFGAGFDPDMEDEIRVTVIATRFDEENSVPGRANLYSEPPAPKPDSRTAEPTKPAKETPKPAPKPEDTAVKPEIIEEPPKKPTPSDVDPFEDIIRIFGNNR